MAIESVQSTGDGSGEGIGHNVSKMMKGHKETSAVAKSKAAEKRSGGRVGVKKQDRNVGVPKGGA
jgi:hypothetical protein